MPSIIRANLADILPVVQQMLARAGVFPASAIFLTFPEYIDSPALPTLDGDSDCFIAVADETLEGHFEHGSAWHDLRVNRVLWLQARTRSELDEVGDKIHFLTDAPLGHLRLEDQMYDALFNEPPLDASGNQLTYERPIFQGIRAPRHRAKGVGSSILVYTLPYRRAVPQLGPLGNG